MSIVTKQQIKDDLSAFGIVEGDIVFFHSSLKSIGQVEGGPDAVLDAFIETIGESGTLVLPALCWYDWDTVDREGIKREWDIKSKATFTGLIPETFRKRTGVLRSDNPTHSVTAYGRLAEEITRDHEKARRSGEWVVDRPLWVADGAFGDGTPWDKLYQLDAKYLLIGCDFMNCTMGHHIQVVYLEDHLKGTSPDIRWPHFSFPLMGKKLEEKGIVQFGHIGESYTRLFHSRSMVDTAIEILLRVGWENLRAKQE